MLDRASTFREPVNNDDELDEENGVSEAGVTEIMKQISRVERTFS
jgi:hypothetical protein